MYDVLAAPPSGSYGAPQQGNSGNSGGPGGYGKGLPFF